MSVRPIDLKTPLASNTESSRLREQQKAAEAGQDHFQTQNQQQGQVKFETVTGPQASEGRVLRKEEEEAEKKKKQGQQGQPGQTGEQAQQPPAENPDAPPDKGKGPPAADLQRGRRIDVKA